jgi:hypothetical protein
MEQTFQPVHRIINCNVPFSVWGRYQARTRHLEKLPNGCQMLWSYFGSGHGKGVHDRAGARLKRSIRNEQMKMETPKLQIVADIVVFYLQRQAEEAELRNQNKEC